MLRRRDFLKRAGLLALAPVGCARPRLDSHGVLVNDVHSQLNPTVVDQVVNADSLAAIQQAIARARRADKAICVAGGRHAMGAQQFATNAVLLDTRKLNQLRSFDGERATIEVEAGMQWPELFTLLHAAQAGQPRQWGIAQKQTGADRMSLGGALAANVHGRGLRRKPIVADIESFTLVDGRGDVHRCSRSENAELFRLAIGGYGLFGIVYSVTLRLVPRQSRELLVTAAGRTVSLGCQSRSPGRVSGGAGFLAARAGHAGNFAQPLLDGKTFFHSSARPGREHRRR